MLIGQPGYPLFDFLARLDDVGLVPYELFYDHGWHLDLESLRRRVTSRTRAIMIVHPNNPTGNFTKRGEREAIEALCREQGLALIVDEVFLDYGLDQRGESFATGSHPVPTFVLSGLSKVAALPQMKAAWIACFAEDEAMQRLEVISDTFLSLSAPDPVRAPCLAEPAGHTTRANQGASSSEPGQPGRNPSAAETGEPACRRGGVVCRASGSRAATPGRHSARSAVGAGSGGASRRFLWFFRSGMAGGEFAYTAGGVQRGSGGDRPAVLLAIRWPLIENALCKGGLKFVTNTFVSFN